MGTKKMSISTSGDHLSSLREVIAAKHGRQDDSDEEDITQDDDDEGGKNSSDTEEGNDNEIIPDDDIIKSEEADSQVDGHSLSEPTAVAIPSVPLDSNLNSEDFVVVTDQDVPPPPGPSGGRRRRRRKTEDGYMWKKQLIFRAKLTMHTAFERADNASPAAVTALAVSKDHKTVYVGDEKGRVFSWSVSSRPIGKGMVDHWVRDEVAEACVDCGIKFTIYERKHHCRNCGKVFCSSCSQYQAEIPRMKIHQPVRVCKPCLDQLSSQAAAAASTPMTIPSSPDKA